MERGRGVNLLLDTHYLIWAAVRPDRIEPWAQEIVTNLRNEVFVSAASFYEIGLKVRRGRLPGVEEFESTMVASTRAMGFEILPLEAEDMLRASRFEAEHADPFDRMIAALALQHDMKVLSNDPALDQFGVRRIKAPARKDKQK